MVVVDIWVEGVADQKFLADILKRWFNIALDKIFTFREEERQLAIRIRLGSGVSSFTTKEGWKNTEPNFSKNPPLKNLIIVDADENFSSRKKEVADTVKGVGFNPQSDLFLWPDHQHHDEKSDLEKLLEQIVSPNHQDVLDCFDAYESCLKASPGKTYVTPNRKAKIFSYSEALSGDGNERKRDYTNPDHWTLLDDKKNPPEVLKPLYDFLKQHLGL